MTNFPLFTVWGNKLHSSIRERPFHRFMQFVVYQGWILDLHGTSSTPQNNWLGNLVQDYFMIYHKHQGTCNWKRSDILSQAPIRLCGNNGPAQNTLDQTGLNQELWVRIWLMAILELSKCLWSMDGFSWIYIQTLFPELHGHILHYHYSCLHGDNNINSIKNSFNRLHCIE